MKEYSEEDYLQLSGIQHFVFCKRQWALIVIEQVWVENYLTQDGRFMHDNAHHGLDLERRGDRLISRGLPVSSRRLGFAGTCDVVEFTKTTDPRGISLHGISGTYLATPIEYKRGKIKTGLEDEMQVAAQALALEEMLSTTISHAYLFYGSHQRRHEVHIDDELRIKVQNTADEMHQNAARNYVPHVKRQPKCNACSLVDICIPKIDGSATVASYIEGFTDEETS